ncbi:MAG: alpha/beta hydrolase [Sphaerochaetaceae bacterium]
MKKPPVVRKCAFPMRLTHSQRPPKAVLLIHGYAGYPGELALAASSLYEAGCDVVVPRLAGHGTNGADFCLTNRHNWLGCVEVELQNMLSMYEEVSLVGHSMGAAIAVLLMAAYSVGPSVVLAPALEIPALNHAAVSLLSLFVKDKKSSLAT